MQKTPMNVEQFKARYPKTYAKVVASATAAEKDRVETILAYIDIDPKTVKETIESGKMLSGRQMAELSIKQNSPDVLARIKAAAAPSVVTEATEVNEKTQKEKDLEAIEKETLKLAGVKDVK